MRVVVESSRVKRFFIALKSEASEESKKRTEFVFVPGQNVVLSISGVVDEKNHIIKRVFSIVSTPFDELIELCVALTPKPSFSSALSDLAIGSALTVEGPFGQFVLGQPKNHVTFIAGGTGIAPLLCMIRSLIKKDFSGSIELFFGVRSFEDYLYRAELENYAKNNGLRISVCASRDASWTGLQGHITDFLPQMLENKGQLVFVCGPQEMIKDTLAVLKKIGFADEQVKKEAW